MKTNGFLRIVVALVMLFVVAAFCSWALPSNSKRDADLAASGQATPETKAIVFPTVTPEPQPTDIQFLVPGVHPHDVTVNLENRQHKCTSADFGEKYVLWSCKRIEGSIDLRVDIYSRWLNGVDLIEASVLQFGTPSLDAAKQYLGFVATMPVGCAMEERMAARSWVEETIPTLQGKGDVRSMDRCGTHYNLYGIPTAITLEIGGLPD